MDTVIPETRITLDPRFFCKNVIVLTFKMSNDFREADGGISIQHASVEDTADLASLSI